MADCCIRCCKYFIIHFNLLALWDKCACLMRLSTCRASAWLQIHGCYYGCWRKTLKLKEVDNLIKKDEHLPFNVSTEVKNLHSGHLSLMDGIKSDSSNCTNKNFRLIHDFKDRQPHQKENMSSELLKKCLPHCQLMLPKMITRRQRKSLIILSSWGGTRLLAWIQMMPSTRIRHPKKGEKTIYVPTSTTDMKQATLAATVTVSGNLLHPLITIGLSA